MPQESSELTPQERAQRDFIANAAHELQSPLAGIISAIEVLQAGAKDTSERDRFLGHIERESRRLERFTRALLVLARAQGLAETPRAEVVELRPLLAGLVETVDAPSGVEISVECEEGLAAVVNRELAEQALRSVIENAVKFTSKGRVDIVGEAVSEQLVQIQVRDTGRGIEPELQPLVFERFFRRADPGHQGFGLGLAIAKEAATALGGRLELESEPGAGTTVTLELPLAARVLS